MSVENEDRNILDNLMNNSLIPQNIDTNEMLKCNNIENCEMNKETREEMLKKIKCLEFAIIELAEYLDTHQDDKKAICLHNQYCKECKDLKDKYQKVYGPLTINYPCNKWRWIEEPWPWEGGRG